MQATYTFDWWGKQRATIRAAVDESRARCRPSAGCGADTGQRASPMRISAGRRISSDLQLARERLATLEHDARVTQLRVTAQLDSGDTVHPLAQDSPPRASRSRS